MPHRIRYTSLTIAAALAGTVLALAPAQAADLDFPAGYGYGDAPPPQTKVEFGSGWYIRGDIGAKNAAENVELGQRLSSDVESSSIVRTSRVGYDLTIGGGYSFLNGFRADIVADFHQPTSTHQYDQPCVSNASPTCYVNGKFDSYDALANIYYDFGTWYRVTPYVGVGAGVAFGQSSVQLYGDPNGGYYGKVGYQNFAFAAMAGLAVDVYPHVKLDLGYRYLNNGTVEGVRVDFQEVRLGLRYMIDN